MKKVVVFIIITVLAMLAVLVTIPNGSNNSGGQVTVRVIDIQILDSTGTEASSNPIMVWNRGSENIF